MTDAAVRFSREVSRLAQKKALEKKQIAKELAGAPPVKFFRRQDNRRKAK